MENKSHALAAGGFVLAISALLLTMALWLMRDTSDRIPVQMHATEAVSGLQPQASVRFRGVEVGVVTAITLDASKPGVVKVDTLIDRNAPITTESVGSLGYQGVTGLAFIQVDTPEHAAQATPIAQAKDTVVLPLSGGFMSRLSEQGGDMMKALQESIERLNRVMSDGNLGNLDRALEQVNQSMIAVTKSADAVTQLAKNTDQLMHQQLDPSKVSLPKLLDETKLAIQDMRSAAGSVETAASNFNSALGRFDAEGGALDQVGQGAQTFTSNTLPRLNSTLENAERTLRQLSRTAQGLSENPQSILYGSGAIPPGPGEAGFQAPASANP